MSFEQGIPARWDMTETGDLVYQFRALNLPNTEQRDTLDLIVTASYTGEIIDTLMTPSAASPSPSARTASRSG